MKTLTDQAQAELSKISVNDMTGITVVQKDKSTAWFKGYRFGKYVERFTVVLTPTGKVKKGSIRFYD